jgi:hypothetical protein
MCNLYSLVTSIEAFRAFVKAFEIKKKRKSNWPVMPGIFPDYVAPIIRNSLDGHSWRPPLGMPSSKQAIFERQEAGSEAGGEGQPGRLRPVAE